MMTVYLTLKNGSFTLGACAFLMKNIIAESRLLSFTTQYLLQLHVLYRAPIYNVRMIRFYDLIVRKSIYNMSA